MTFWLGRELRARCLDYGDRLRAATGGRRLRDGIPRKNDPEYLGKTKMAECVVALCLGFDLERLDWGVDDKGVDPGYDLAFGRNRIQVKWTETGERLIWPRDKNHQWDATDFTHLGLVTGNNDLGFDIHGYITKAAFAAQKKVGAPLWPGTWYVEQASLKQIFRWCGF